MAESLENFRAPTRYVDNVRCMLAQVQRIARCYVRAGRGSSLGTRTDTGDALASVESVARGIAHDINYRSRPAEDIPRRNRTRLWSFAYIDAKRWARLPLLCAEIDFNHYGNLHIVAGLQ